jgi:hypothetical protein
MAACMHLAEAQYLLEEPPSQEALLAEARVFAARFRTPPPRVAKPQLSARSAPPRRSVAQRRWLRLAA